ncbi:type II secretion system F family protein [Nocardia uniformis]|uniref:Type II secretion system F family protein n=1 Tax=Nocardia uniformis TaxID=53432 RepID=A0A849C3V4_9NOCA|nr:type II secretion system F family protein [Nocardia uniformis]NNH73374.1 type II secretion system F family protein [Nocardia uniformis]
MSVLSTPVLILAVAILVWPGRVAGKRRLRLLTGRQGPDTRAAPGVDADPLAAAAVLDLFAACLRAGLPTAAAAGAVVPSAPEPVATVLRRAADLLALGADPTTAWDQASAGVADEAVVALARMARRSARSGASLAVAITELAQQRRTEVEDAAAARAERAGVLISGPLGLCFLPAFLCLGIVPVVIGLAGHVLNGGLL